jgi:hypothetical protein
MNVTTLELHNGCLPTGGMVLSNSTALESESATPSWFSTNTEIPASVSSPTLAYQLITSPVAVGEGMVDATENREGADLDLTKYTLVGSKLIYETNKTATVAAGYGSVTDTSGYYYKIGYTVGDGPEYIRYFALPQIARNHDYQVRARVDAGGELTFTVIVNEWSVEDRVDLDYQNTVTVSENDRLVWEKVIADADGDGTADTIVENGKVNDGVLYFPSTTGQEAVCHFSLKSPVDGEWQAELVHVSGETGHFTFSDATIKVKDENGTESELSGITGEGTSLLRGPISNGVITLKIQTAKSNAAASGGMAGREPCRVRLEITAKKTWGGAERTYRVYALTGLYKDVNGQMVDINYELEQIPTL